jgi:hypothetical protein
MFSISCVYFLRDYSACICYILDYACKYLKNQAGYYSFRYPPGESSIAYKDATTSQRAAMNLCA